MVSTSCFFALFFLFLCSFPLTVSGSSTMMDFVAVGKPPVATNSDRRIKPILAVRGSFAKRQIQVKSKLDNLVLLNKRPTRVGITKENQVLNPNTKLTTVQKSTKKIGVIKRTRRTRPQRPVPLLICVYAY